MNKTNRDLTFRVWNDKTKEWIYGPHKIDALDGVNLFGETIMFGELLRGILIEDYNHCIPLQFTGLRDKKGIKIYEGDVVKFKWLNPAEEVEETQGEVFWDEKMAMFCFDKSFNFSMNDSCFIEETMEVVGDIFEGAR